MALSKKLKPGDPIRSITAKWIEDVSEILDKLEGIGCTIERTGNRWIINTESVAYTDVKVGVDSEATPDYIGAAFDDGVIRLTSNAAAASSVIDSLHLADGGDFITLSHGKTTAQASVDNSGDTVIQDVELDDAGHVTSLTSHTIAASPDVKVGVDSGATAGYLGATGSTGVFRVDAPLEIADGGDFITTSIADGTSQYQVLTWSGSAWVNDWVKAHA